jgi:hypothetical protein
MNSGVDEHPRAKLTRAQILEDTPPARQNIRKRPVCPRFPDSAIILVVWYLRQMRRRAVEQKPSGGRQLVFGFQEEWRDFEKRNAPFLERFANLEKAINIAFLRTPLLSEPIDRFVLTYGKVCVQDFNEILLCCGNGAGLAAQKLLRGLYERAVTLRYLHENPAEIDDFLDYYHVGQRKLMLACQDTMGAATFPPDQVTDIEAAFKAVKEKFMVTACEDCGTKRLNHTWSKLDFVAMAKKTSLGPLYAIAYTLPLRHAHATVGSMLSQLEVSGSGGMAFVDGPQRNDADKALRIAHNVFLDVLRVQDEHFDLPALEAQNKICSQDFVDIWRGSADAKEE